MAGARAPALRRPALRHPARRRPPPRRPPPQRAGRHARPPHSLTTTTLSAATVVAAAPGSAAAGDAAAAAVADVPDSCSKARLVSAYVDPKPTPAPKPIVVALDAPPPVVHQTTQAGRRPQPTPKVGDGGDRTTKEKSEASSVSTTPTHGDERESREEQKYGGRGPGGIGPPTHTPAGTGGGAGRTGRDDTRGAPTDGKHDTPQANPPPEQCHPTKARPPATYGKARARRRRRRRGRRPSA